jgi:hypothetical protein
MLIVTDVDALFGCHPLLLLLLLLAPADPSAQQLLPE